MKLVRSIEVDVLPLPLTFAMRASRKHKDVEKKSKPTKSANACHNNCPTIFEVKSRTKRNEERCQRDPRPLLNDELSNKLRAEKFSFFFYLLFFLSCYLCLYAFDGSINLLQLMIMSYTIHDHQILALFTCC